MKEKRKQVSFGEGPVEKTYFLVSSSADVTPSSDTNDSCDRCPQQALKRKNEFWYTEEELLPCREDARKAIQALHQVDGQVDAVVDPDVCLHGIEKFADTGAKRRGQRMLVESVLQQQLSNKRRRKLSDCEKALEQASWKEEDERHIASISRYLSQPFKEMARYYAMKTAENERQTRDQEGADASNTAPTSDRTQDSFSQPHKAENGNVYEISLADTQSPMPVLHSTNKNLLFNAPNEPLSFTTYRSSGQLPGPF